MSKKLVVPAIARRVYVHIMHDSLYRNSVYLMASTLVSAFFGFIFWVVIARLVQPEEIGIATALISASALITQISLLGLKEGIVRYVPTSSNKNTTISTSLSVLTLFTVVLCLLFVLFLPVFAPKLLFIRDNIAYLLLFVVSVTSFSLNQFQEGVFVAYRAAGYVLAKNAVWGVIKVLSPLVFYGFGAHGVFFAFSAGSIVSVLFGLTAMMQKFGFAFSPGIDKSVVKKIGKFSLGNYIGGFFTNAPSLILPLVIIQHIGASESAYYYIDLQIASLLYVIPIAATQSLFAESSHDEEALKKHVKKTSLLISLLMIPAILTTIVFGDFVLRVFGVSYAGNGLAYLRLLAITGIFVSINSIGNAVLNIQRRIKMFVILSFLSALLVLLFSVAFLPYRLIGIGWAQIAGEGIISVVYLLVLRRALR